MVLPEPLPSLAILIPFDLGHPLSIPSKAPSWDGTFSRSRELAPFAIDRRVQSAFGPDVVVAVKTEAPRYLEMNSVTESESFPYGTNAILGSSLRLRSASGVLLKKWREEAIAIMDTPSSIDFTEDRRVIEVLQSCRLDAAIDAFGCGAACLRLFVWLAEIPALETVQAVANLFEYALYGDVPVAADSIGRLDAAHRALRSIRNAMVQHFGDERAGRALRREHTLFRDRPEGMALRWASHILTVEKGEQLELAAASIRPPDEDHGPTTGSMADIKDSTFRFRDGPWMSLISVTDNDMYFRVLYVMTASEAISLLMINVALDLDEKLSAAMLSGEAAAYSDRDLRDIRFFTQTVRGLASTWRISAADTDIAIADSRARHYLHERYQRHLATASETIYALESARLSDRQRKRTDAIGAAP